MHYNSKAQNIPGPFNMFKPMEVILKLAEKFTGIKGISEFVIKEMDPEVKLRKIVLFMVHKGVLLALSAIAPIANCAHCHGTEQVLVIV